VADEIVEIGENLRHYSSARFTRLNECLIANAALLGAMQIDALKGVRVLVPVLGFLFTLAFGVMCERAAAYYWSFRQYAEAKESLGDFRMYSSLPKRKAYFNTSIAMRMLFGLLLLMWILLAIWMMAHGA
jgi:hypothetical protein